MRTASTSTRPCFLLRHAWLWLVPLSVVVALLLAEAVLRFFPSLLPADAHQRVLWLTQTEVNTIADPYLGFVYRPYYTVEVDSLDFRYTVESDEHGFRNPSPWPERADIVIVGDSMAYGYGVERRDGWPALVDQALPGARVITLGMPGAVPRQYVRYFERFGAALQPRLVIFTIFPGNDLIDSATFDRWIAAGSPGNYDVWRFFEGRIPTRAHALRDRSRLVLALSSIRKSMAQGYASSTLTLPGGARLRLAPSRYATAMQRNRPGDPGFDAIVSAAAEARDRARAAGCEFLVLMIPTKERVYLPLQGKVFPGLIHPLMDVLENEQGITVIDVTDALTARAQLGERLYFEVDGHPNELGNRVIADAVIGHLHANAQSLGLRGLLPTEPQPDRARAR